jgi:hypothetical protein
MRAAHHRAGPGSSGLPRHAESPPSPAIRDVIPGGAVVYGGHRRGPRRAQGVGVLAFTPADRSPKSPCARGIRCRRRSSRAPGRRPTARSLSERGRLQSHAPTWPLGTRRNARGRLRRGSGPTRRPARRAASPGRSGRARANLARVQAGPPREIAIAERQVESAKNRSCRAGQRERPLWQALPMGDPRPRARRPRHAQQPRSRC